MNKSIFAVALLFAATPVALTSCSKSSEDQVISFMNDIAEIMEKTTDENAEAMLKKLVALESKVSEIAAANKMLESDKKNISPEKEKEVFSAFIRLNEEGKKLDSIESDTVKKVSDKAGEIFRKSIFMD